MHTAPHGFSGRWQPGAAASLSCWGARAQTFEDGTLTLAFAGDLFGLDALARALEQPAGTPAAALLAAAWRRWGSALALHLDGAFALAVADAGALHLFSDASGVQHVYAFANARQLSFASHLDSLLALPGVPRELAPQALHEYLRFGDVAAPNTWFAGVRSVPAGEWLHWHTPAAEPRIETPAQAPLALPARFDDAVAQYEALLQGAVDARLAGSARPAAYLSGGIDSSLLCALARQRRADLVALTVGFDGAGFDESPLAGRIAAQLGLRHEVLRFDPTEFQQALQTMGATMEQPSADPALPATVLAFAHAGARFDCVLDGMGADESAGALPPRHLRAAVGIADRLNAPLRRGVKRTLQRLPARLAGYAPIFDFEHPAELFIRWHGFTRAEIEALCGVPVSFEQTRFFRTFARFRRDEHFARYSALIDAMPGERLNQALLATGAPLRFPFWSGAADRYLRALPQPWRWQPAQPKRVLRVLLARHVAPSLWDVPKHGFDFPLQEFIKSADFRVIRTLLDPEPWCTLVGLDPAAVQALARRFIGGERPLAFRVWTLVVLAAWLQQRP